MDEKTALKELQACIAGLKCLTDKDLSFFEREAVLRKAREAASSLQSTLLSCLFERLSGSIAAEVDKALESRRETLLLGAQQAGIPAKRYHNYDRIGPFKVLYKDREIRLELGSEPAAEFEAPDGKAAFQMIRDEMRALEKEPFDRTSFFQAFRTAYRMMRDNDETRQEGWAQIRTLYAYVALSRQAQSKDFLKRPGPKTFRPYSAAQFVYDLARFGKEGWMLGDESIRSHTPNMATIATGRVMALPSLDSLEILGPQIDVVRIEKRRP